MTVANHRPMWSASASARLTSVRSMVEWRLPLRKLQSGHLHLVKKELAIAALEIEPRPGLFQSASGQADIKALLGGCWWDLSSASPFTMRKTDFAFCGQRRAVTGTS
jgi:hypothetical protein